MHKVREGLMVAQPDLLTGTVEIDETYVGGKEGNKHWNKRLHAGRGTAGKVAVIGAIQRRGRVVAQPIPTTDRRTMTRFVKDHVKPKSTVCTDEHKSYRTLGRTYDHRYICHRRYQYVHIEQPEVHTNTIESFWALLKRTYLNTHHHWSRKHIHRYVTEITGRFNMRGEKSLVQMQRIFLGMIGRVLTYRQLVGASVSEA